MTPPSQASIWMILRCLLVTLIPAITHLLAHNLSIYIIVFFHSFMAFIFLLPWVFSKGIQGIFTKKLHLHCLRGIVSATALLLWCYALSIMPYAEALSLSFMWAVCSIILAAYWFKERITLRIILPLTGSILGTCLILMPGAGLFQPAAMWVLATVLLWSFADIIIKILTSTESNKTQCFYITLFMSLFTLPLAIQHWQTPSPSQMLYLMLQGGMFSLSMVALFKAYKNTRLCDIMPLDFSRLLFMTLISFFLLHEPLTLQLLCGSSLILGSTLCCLARMN